MLDPRETTWGFSVLWLLFRSLLGNNSRLGK